MEDGVHIVPSVMPKMKFVKITLQVLFATMMMYASQPPLQIHNMNMQIGKILTTI